MLRSIQLFFLFAFSRRERESLLSEPQRNPHLLGWDVGIYSVYLLEIILRTGKYLWSQDHHVDTMLIRI